MSISISCPHCRRPYRLKEESAGKRVKCRDCGEPFAVPKTIAPATELTPAGTPLYRHKPKETPAPLATGATPFLADIERHIERTIGPAPMVFHEIISPEVHLDLHVVPPRNDEPSEEHPFGTSHYTIITSGVSSHPMNLPEGSALSLRYAEMMIALPADWPGMKPDGTFDQAVMKDEANWWPLRWLKNVARMPHSFETFVAPGHTIPNGDPAEPFASGTRFCCMLVLIPLLAPKSHKLIINDDITVNFYALWPLYREEMDLKLQRGMDPLIDKFDDAKVTELIHVDRKNTCKRGFWPFGR
jgi:predicted Zn finger-like uncharacterized protein